MLTGQFFGFFVQLSGCLIGKEKMFDSYMVGSSRAMQNVSKLVKKVAKSDVTVLVTGESGTGKEMVAHNIFKLSSRNRQNYLKLNCAAIPAELLESQMFGHEKGAFTGAIARQTGCFERADKGTLFLDEVGDMALMTQTKLLRVLQEQEFERIGGKETIKVDVRIIAATNKNLTEEISKGRFREDLFYRLNVVEIHIPPLRERAEDLEELVDFFIVQFCNKYNKTELKFESKARDVLKAYSWPGNVRELRNILERAVVLSHSDKISIEDLPEKLLEKEFEAPVEEEIMTLQEMERKYVKKVLEYTGGNKLKAARLLNIDPKTLRSKIG